MRHPFRFALPLIAMLAVSPVADAVMLTYGFNGTVSVLSPYDPYNVLLGQVLPGETAVDGTFRIDSAALDGDPGVDRALYSLLFDADAFLANVGVLAFHNDGSQIAVGDDRPRGNTLVDSITVFTTGTTDPVVWPEFGYRLHTNTLALEYFDTNLTALALSGPIAPLPPLENLGPGGLGQLYVEGCRLVVGQTECGAAYRFRIQADIDDIYLVPEPATGMLLLLGLAALAAQSAQPLSRSTRCQRNDDASCAR